MKKFILFTLVTLLAYPATSFAGKACYSTKEAEAEQGIRIHSELMVIGLNCAHMADANGNNLYLEHQKFTAKHEDLFQTYEGVLMEYMRKNGVANPDKSLHLLRTKFANKISNDVAKMRPDIFCRTHSSRIETVSKMSREALRKWAATPFKEAPVSKPFCTNG